jgi:hypothetical protein
MPGIKRDVLERPFDQSVIRTRRGPHGPINYVEGAEIIRRLNEAFDAAWDFTVVEKEVRDAEVIVLGKLTAAGITKTAFGSSSLTTSRETGEVVSVGDDLKAACTDSLKKCATMFGVGLHLYGDAQPTAGSGNGNGRTTNGNGSSATHGGNGNGNGGTPRTAAPRTPDRLTQKQLSAIWAIARRLGLSTEDVRERCTAAHGLLPEYLSRADASALIAELQAESEPAGAVGAP